MPHQAASVVALLVAAGSGTRLGGGVPKQFRELGTRPLFTYALQTLSTQVERVVIVVPDGWQDRARDMAQSAGCTVDACVQGGDTRQASVRNGLRALQENDWRPAWVLVHDAARPFVTAAQVRQVVEAATQSGAATLGCPVADTLVHAAARRVQRIVDRDATWTLQTPQAFDADVFREAHDKAAATDAPDDTSLVMTLGRDVALVEGSWWNLKVTSASDLVRAEWILSVGGPPGDAPPVKNGR